MRNSANHITIAKLTLATLLMLTSVVKSNGQGTSNKGKDFWIGYTDHRDAGNSSLVLYITSDVNTQGTVSVPGQYTKNFTVTANSITEVPVPSSIAYVGTSEVIEKKGIHVVSDDDIIIYSHIYHSARSEATLVLPVHALGAEYYAMTYEQVSQELHRRSEFMVIAIEDNTTVEITPTQITQGGKPANVPFTIVLDSGDCYQVQSLTDLTGSRIIVVDPNPGSCKKVAVFSGSGFTQLGCTNATSGDNLYEQLYPVSSWGKNFATAPFASRNTDVYRIIIAEDGTNVTVNGNTKTYNKGQIDDFLSSEANYITASKPICLAQFSRTQNCDMNVGDPSMIIVPPIEQGLKDVTLYSSPFQDIYIQYINVIIPTNATNTFTIDGNPVTNWNTIPSNKQYSFAQISVTWGNHNLHADANFVAIAYGFGQVESYGYVAGANAKDLTVETVLADTACQKHEISFSANLSYSPSSWKWYFGDGNSSTDESPMHTYDTSGRYTVSLVTVNGSGAGCGSSDSTVREIDIIVPPEAGFSPEDSVGCRYVAFSFQDSSWYPAARGFNLTWDFGDGSPPVNTNTAGGIVQHTYTEEGKFDVSLIFNNGFCPDTVSRINEVRILDAPEPGIIANKTEDCPPFEIMVKDSAIDIALKKYYFGNGDSIECNPITDTCDELNYTYTKAGFYTMIQKLTGVTGCVVYDTMPIKVIDGFLPNQSAEMIYTSVLTNTTNIIEWKPVQRILRYDIYRDGNRIASTTNTTYTDTVKNTQPITYRVAAVDTCEKVLQTDIAKTIHLTGTANANQHSNLNWTAYEKWQYGVSTYVLEAEDTTSTFKQVTSTGNAQFTHQDNDFANGGKVEKCYRIRADEQGGNGASSYSNVVCLPYQAVIWVPNAFSPNGDGDNDYWLPSTFGVNEYTLRIFNRWGEKIYETHNTGDAWDGKNAPNGVYLYMIIARGLSGNFHYLNGTITLIR